MSLPVIFRTEADTEFEQAYDWYESRRPGYGAAFAAEIQRTVDRIASNPLSYAEVFIDIREAPVRRFPYRVFYRP